MTLTMCQNTTQSTTTTCMLMSHTDITNLLHTSMKLHSEPNLPMLGNTTRKLSRARRTTTRLMTACGAAQASVLHTMVATLSIMVLDIHTVTDSNITEMTGRLDTDITASNMDLATMDTDSAITIPQSTLL